jgi:hypothetical protein
MHRAGSIARELRCTLLARSLADAQEPVFYPVQGQDPGRAAAAGAMGGAAALSGARRQNRRQAAGQQQPTTGRLLRK